MRRSPKRWQPFPPPTPPVLDTFTKGYIGGALWSELDDEEEPLDKNYEIEDIAPEALAEMIADAAKFQTENWEDIQDDLFKAGLDFWLTRNRHGAGFWDGDWPKEVGKRLTKNSHAYGEVHLYVGNDRLLYYE